MQPRPLETENRIFGLTAADKLRVSLGRAVSEISDTPTMGNLISNKIRQESAGSNAITIQEREELNALSERQYIIEWNLSTETDVSVRDELLLELDQIYLQNKTQKDLILQQAITDGRLASKEDLTEMYGDQLTFDGPMAPEKAKLLYENAKAEYIRNAIIARSPTGVLPTIAKFAGGIYAMASDPIEIATMFIPVVGQTSKVASIARFGKVVGRARVGAIEGTAGALLTEPLYYGMSKDQQLDYSMQEALFNVGAGFFLGGAIGTVAGMYSRIRNPDVTVAENLIKADAPNVSQSDIPFAEGKSVRSDEGVVSKEASARANKQASELYKITGGKITYEVAIRQFVTDQSINVSMLVPKAVNPPRSLNKFIKDRGGINDSDPTFRGELKSRDVQAVSEYKSKKGKRVLKSISNPKSQANLDDMADIAFQEGYISKRDPNLLMAAIQEELSGNPVFAKQDMEEVAAWEEFEGSEIGREAEITRREDIRSELEENNITNVSDEEIAIISEKMSGTDDSAVDVYSKVSKLIEDKRAEMIARHGADINNYVGVEPDEAARFDEYDPEIDPDIQNEQYERIVFQLEQANGLSQYSKDGIAEINRLTEEAKAIRDVATVAARCEATR